MSCTRCESKRFVSQQTNRFWPVWVAKMMDRLSFGVSSKSEHTTSCIFLPGLLILFHCFSCRAAVCGSIATKEVTGDATRICGFHQHGNLFITAGERMYRSIILFYILKNSRFVFQIIFESGKLTKQ